MISIDRLNVRYGSRPVLTDLSLGPLPGGTLIALVGPNAAGKSTLLRALAGVVRSAGRVDLDGSALLTMGFRERAKRLAFMPQTLPSGIELSVLEGVLHALRASPTFDATQVNPVQRAYATIDGLGLGGIASQSMDRLSGGQRQMVSLAQALVRSPRLLLLDEPTSALDLRHQIDVMSAVQGFAKSGAIVIAVLHDLSLAAQWAGHMVIMSNGRVHSSGMPREVVTPEMLQDVYRVNGRIESCSRGMLQISIDGRTSD